MDGRDIGDIGADVARKQPKFENLGEVSKSRAWADVADVGKPILKIAARHRPTSA
jgi:hypothetical protein